MGCTSQLYRQGKVNVQATLLLMLHREVEGSHKGFLLVPYAFVSKRGGSSCLCIKMRAAHSLTCMFLENYQQMAGMFYANHLAKGMFFNAKYVKQGKRSLVAKFMRSSHSFLGPLLENVRREGARTKLLHMMVK